MRRALLIATLSAAAARGAAAQEPPPDSARADSARRAVPTVPGETSPATQGRDSTGAARVGRDTVKAPLGRAEAPPTPRRRFDREALFRWGTVTALDLFEGIPGFTGLRAGWLPAPHVVVWMGEPGRGRVLWDGVELDALDPRDRGIGDLAGLPWWLAEDAAVETSPTEARLHLRSWRATRTTPETRVDVATGDEETNAYRGYFARRFQSGLGAQFAFQQFGTQSPRLGGDGDHLGLATRVGWARGSWSADVAGFSVTRARRALARVDADTGAIGPFEGRESLGYVRVAWRDPDAAGVWAHALVAGQGWRESSRPPRGGDGPALPVDTVDSAAARTQYVAAVGGRYRGATWSATVRYRRFGGEGHVSPAIRAAWGAGRWIRVDAYAERASHDSLVRADGRVTLRPWSFVEVAGALGLRRAFGGDSADPRGTTRSAVLTGGVRWRGLWLRGGVVARGEALLLPPAVFGGGYEPVRDSAQTAVLAQLEGRVWKDLFVEAFVLQWDRVGPYRPRTETRGRVYVDSRWLSRFPKGEFRILAALTYEARGDAPFPAGGRTVPAIGVPTWSSNLEIQLQSGTLFWQWRNVTGELWSSVPGFAMPRLVNLYGVRWAFSN